MRLATPSSSPHSEPWNPKRYSMSTVRERDSMSQERVGLDRVETYLKTRLPVC